MSNLKINITKIDVWRGVWRCTHAKLAPLTPHPLTRIATTGLRRDKDGNTLRQATFLPPFLLWLLKCADGATTLSLRFGIDQDLSITGLDGKLVAGCLRSGLAWIIFCFRILPRWEKRNLKNLCNSHL